MRRLTPLQGTAGQAVTSRLNMRFSSMNEVGLTVVKKPPTTHALDAHLNEILELRSLTALFQPIVDLSSGTISAYEGLIRGPLDSPLHSPLELFRVAALYNQNVALDHLCRRVTLESFVRLGLPGDLFLNILPNSLLEPETHHGETLGMMRDLGIDPKRIVIELTEQQQTNDYDLMRKAVQHYCAMGFRIAIHDLGEGFSSLRLWSELRPEFVKIDRHFVQHCEGDSIKKQFLRSIQEIARNAGSQVIAEGIETLSELNCVREIGIARGQGYYLTRPTAQPPFTIADEVAASFVSRAAVTPDRGATAETLMRSIISIAPTALIDDAYAMFENNPELQSLPVVEHGTPRGIIGRHALIDHLARPYSRELFGRKPCHRIMNSTPLLIEINTPLQELSRIVADAAPNHLADGFIVVENGHYRGVCTGHDLIRETYRMQINAARHANALSGLPGNDPLNTMLSVWLDSRQPFRVAYFDLDNFKPFNDVYGFARGDDAIRMLTRALCKHCNGASDFVAHIGGDDFMVLFRSPEWEQACRDVMDAFSSDIRSFFSIQDIARQGYMAEDRRGERVLVPLVTLSIGVVEVDCEAYSTYHQVSAAAADAKKEAKKILGNSLYVERRVTDLALKLAS